MTLENTDSGTFMLGFDGQTTAPIAWNATAAQVETALEELAAIDNVTVSKSGAVYPVTFAGALAGTNVSQLHGAVRPDNDGTLQRLLTRGVHAAACHAAGCYPPWLLPSLAATLPGCYPPSGRVEPKVRGGLTQSMTASMTPIMTIRSMRWAA